VVDVSDDREVADSALVHAIPRFVRLEGSRLDRPFQTEEPAEAARRVGALSATRAASQR
jgi:hypothetical protein